MSRPIVVTTIVVLMLMVIALLTGCSDMETVSPTAAGAVVQPTAASTQPPSQAQGDLFETPDFSIVIPKGWEKMTVEGGVNIFKQSGEQIAVRFTGSNQNATWAKQNAENLAKQYNGTPPQEVVLLDKPFWKTTFTATDVFQTSYLRIDNGRLLTVKLAGKDHETNKEMKAIMESLVFKVMTVASTPTTQASPSTVAKVSPSAAAKTSPTSLPAATKPAAAGATTATRTPPPMHSLEGLSQNKSAQLYTTYKAYEAFPIVKLGMAQKEAIDALKATGMVEMQASRPSFSNIVEHYYWFESATADKADKTHIKLEIISDKVVGKHYIVNMAVAKDTGFLPLQTIYNALLERYQTGKFKTLADAEAVLGKGYTSSERYALTDSPSSGVHTRYRWRGSRGTSVGVIELAFDEKGAYKGIQGVGLMN